MTMLVSTMDIVTGMRSFASKRRADNLQQRRSWLCWGFDVIDLWSTSFRCVRLLVSNATLNGCLKLSDFFWSTIWLTQNC